MKHLKKKDRFSYNYPDAGVLDTFKNPGVTHVVMEATEVTALCPITGQPDYYSVEISYYPRELCLESKSLKLYLGSYRMEGMFAETLAALVKKDIAKVLMCAVWVEVKAASRGGITIKATAGGSDDQA